MLQKWVEFPPLQKRFATPVGDPNDFSKAFDLIRSGETGSHMLSHDLKERCSAWPVYIFTGLIYIFTYNWPDIYSLADISTGPELLTLRLL